MASDKKNDKIGLCPGIPAFKWDIEEDEKQTKKPQTAKK